jgi:hypothetical protein
MLVRDIGRNAGCFLLSMLSARNDIERIIEEFPIVDTRLKQLQMGNHCAQENLFLASTVSTTE